MYIYLCVCVGVCFVFCGWKGVNIFHLTRICVHLGCTYVCVCPCPVIPASHSRLVCDAPAQVVRMTISMMHGDEHCCGSTTSGGTESLLLACKAYRDYARRTRGITDPEM